MTHGDNGGSSEAALVIRGRGGDRSAFEQLVRSTARWVYVRVYLKVPDVHRTEDLVQETYLRAWSKIGTLSDPKAFRGWLAAIADGVVLDSVKQDTRKKRGGGLEPQGDEQLKNLAAPAPPPSESLERDERRTQMLKLLSELPDEYRDVLTLRYLAGADYETIGKQLAISNGSLRGLLSRGMKLLREKISSAESPSPGTAGEARIIPSPGTPGEGQGGGSSGTSGNSATGQNPHPNPPPAYRERGTEGISS